MPMDKNDDWMPGLYQQGSVHSLWVRWKPWRHTWNADHPVARFLYDAGRIPPSDEQFRLLLENRLEPYVESRVREIDRLETVDYDAERREPLAFEGPPKGTGRTPEQRTKDLEERALLIGTLRVAKDFVAIHRIWHPYTIDELGS